MPTTVHYVVGVEHYPYRIDGLRLSDLEAVSVLKDREGLTAMEAQHRLDLVCTQAVHDAPAPRVTRVLGGGRYRIEGGPELSLDQTIGQLIRLWRLTPPEAAHAVDRAITR